MENSEVDGSMIWLDVLMVAVFVFTLLLLGVMIPFTLLKLGLRTGYLTNLTDWSCRGNNKSPGKETP
jgi:hypothetical protein